MGNVNKILGAVGLTTTSGSLTQIPSDIITTGDVAFVVTSYNNGDLPRFYVFKCDEHDAQSTTAPSPTEPPFSDENPPLVLMPEDNINTTKRWHLASINGFRRNIKQEIGKYVKTSEIKCYDTFTISDVNDNPVLFIDNNGNVLIDKIETNSTDLVENLNAERVTGISGNNIMTLDGQRAFSAPVFGADPTREQHLTTKNYVDQLVGNINSDTFMKKDGSTAFLAPTSGVNPTSDYHLATKIYVDSEIEEKLESIETDNNTILYKNGLQDIPNNASEVTVIFGGTLENYTVHPCVQNIIDSEPAGFMITVVDQTETSFTVNLNGYTDSENYKLSWMIVAY